VVAHPNRHRAGWQGILQADACGGCNGLHRGDRDPGPVGGALCWSHARRKFLELADIKGNVRVGKSAHEISPVARDAVARIAALFDIEGKINGLDATSRLRVRRRSSRPPVEDLHACMKAERDTMSKQDPVAKAIGHMFSKNRWDAFTVPAAFATPPGAMGTSVKLV
jgi:hypothetical protein